jgi:hypothetical protein
VELTAYYKLDHYMSDAGQFGTTPAELLAFQNAGNGVSMER